MTINNLVNNQKGFTVIEGLVVLAFATVAITGTMLVIKGNKAYQQYMNGPKIERANVIGGPEAELFINKNGQRFYAEIDGKPVMNYLKNK